MKTIKERSAELVVSAGEKISRQLSVFYNPAMEMNRDISVLLLKSFGKKGMQIADPLAASGIRSIRFLKELERGAIKNISINDSSSKAAESIGRNLALNGINPETNPKIRLSCADANLFFLNSAGFDYIDLDPFGNPNNFLDSACKRMSRGGIIAVTATDTSALCGTFPEACIRKYWALPKKGPMMHEIGLRILIRKIQLIAAQYEKALLPIYSYSKDHYMRTFLRCEKGKMKADEILKKHGFFDDAGPMWLGQIFDRELADSIYLKASKDKPFKSDGALLNFLKLIMEESKINSIGFYDLHQITKKFRIKKIPKKDYLIARIRKKGFRASGTHFRGEGIRSDIHLKELIKILREQKFD